MKCPKKQVLWKKSEFRKKKHHSSKNKNIENSNWQKFRIQNTKLLSVCFLKILVFEGVVFFFLRRCFFTAQIFLKLASFCAKTVMFLHKMMHHSHGCGRKIIILFRCSILGPIFLNFFSLIIYPITHISSKVHVPISFFFTSLYVCSK